MVNEYVYKDFGTSKIEFWRNESSGNFWMSWVRKDAYILFSTELVRYELDPKYRVMTLEAANRFVDTLPHIHWWRSDKTLMIKDIREAAARWAKEQIDAETENVHVETLSKALEARKGENEKLQKEYDVLSQEYDDLDDKFDRLQEDYHNLVAEVYIGDFEVESTFFSFQFKQQVQILAVKMDGVWKKVRFEFPDGTHKIVEGLIPAIQFIQLNDWVKQGKLVKAL